MQQFQYSITAIRKPEQHVCKASHCDSKKK